MSTRTDREFEALVLPHRRELHAFCYRMLGSVQDADDALQEALLGAWRAWRGWGGFEGRGSLLCRQCGVRAFTRGGALLRFDGEFYAVNVACLDDASDEELSASPIHFANGRHGRWEEPAEHRYL